MTSEIVAEIGVFFSYMSFWWLAIGLFLVLARMPTPGMKMVDKAKFFARKIDLDKQLASRHGLKLIDQILLYSGRYFFIYHYYRNDLVLLFVIGGASFLKLLSVLMDMLIA